MKLAVLRFYIRQLNWFMVIFTLLVFSGLIKLGLWQTERALEKEQRLVSIEKYQTQQALSFEALQVVMNKLQDINDIPIELTGDFIDKYIFLHDNQTHKGRLGYRVLQVLAFEDKKVLVNLGWVQGSVNRTELPKINALVGKHTIKGHIRIVDNGIVLSEQIFNEITWPIRVQQIELDKFSQIIGEKLLPFVVYLDKTEVIGFEKNWQPIVMPPEKHRAYAFQWFSLAMAWLILMICASIYWARYDNKNNKKV